jgi:hypothetical protein
MDAGGDGSGAMNPYSPPAAALDPAGPPAFEGGGYAFKPTIGLAKTIAAVMALDTVLELASGANAFLTIGVMRRVAAGEKVAHATLAAIDARAQGMARLGWFLFIVAVVLFCLLLPRANRNARAFGAPMSDTPGWAVGWFFVPVASWWKPYYAVKEIWQGSDPDPAVHSLQSGVSVLLPLWWWLWLVRCLAGAIVRQLSPPVHTAADLIAACQAHIVLVLPSAASALLAAAVVLGLARRQEERRHRQSAGTQSATAAAAP